MKTDDLQVSQPFCLVWRPAVLLVHDAYAIVMNQVIVAVDTLFLISRTGVEHGAVGQHGPAFVGHGQEVAMAFLALGIVEGRVGGLPVFLAIVFLAGKMLDHVFEAVNGLGEKEVEGFVRRGQMAVHAVGYESLRVVHMGGRPPGHHRRFDFMAGGAEFGGGCSHHGVVRHAEQGKCDHDPHTDQNGCD